MLLSPDTIKIYTIKMFYLFQKIFASKRGPPCQNVCLLFMILKWQEECFPVCFCQLDSCSVVSQLILTWYWLKFLPNKLLLVVVFIF